MSVTVSKHVIRVLCLLLTVIVLIPCSISLAEKPEPSLRKRDAAEFLPESKMSAEELLVAKKALIQMPQRVQQGQQITLKIKFPEGLSDEFKKKYNYFTITFGIVHGAVYGIDEDIFWDRKENWIDRQTYRLKIQCGTPCCGNLEPGQYAYMITLRSVYAGEVNEIFLKESPLEVCRPGAEADISLSKKKLTMITDSTYQLKLTGATGTVKWLSSNKKIATVSKTGVVKALKKGTCTITAKVNNKSYNCKLTVNQAVKKIKLNKSKLKLKEGESFKLKATITPSNAANKSVQWSSNNNNVAKVSSRGVITAVGEGTAEITAAAADGSKVKTSVTVTVVGGDPYRKYKDTLAQMETAMAKDPWSPDRIRQTFIDEYGDEAFAALDMHREYEIQKDGIILSYGNYDWYYTYSVWYLNSAGKKRFKLVYIRVADPSHCNINDPTYTNWFVPGLTFGTLNTSRASYWLYWGDDQYNQLNIYVDKKYYDHTTVTELAAFSDNLYYQGLPD